MKRPAHAALLTLLAAGLLLLPGNPTPARGPAPAPEPAFPEVTVRMPETGASYGDSVEIRGEVATEGGPARLRWRIRGTDRRGELPLGPDGSFAAFISTAGERGEITIDLTATREDGRWFTKCLTLREGPRVSAREQPRPTELPPASAQAPSPAAGRVERPETPAATQTAPPAPPAARPAADMEAPVAAEAPAAGETSAEPSAAATAGAPEQPEEPAFDPGTAAPVLSLEAPVAGDAYGLYLEVRGTARIEGRSDGLGIAAIEVGVSSSSYELGSVPFRATVATARDGSFSLAVPARGLRGNQTVTVVARSSNGAAASAAVGVTQGTSGIPSFAARGSDGAARLTWSRVHLAERFDLSLTADGTTAVRRDVRSPLELTGLSNGTLYAFRLEATLSTGEAVSSAVVRVIPLSAATLRPQAVGEYGRIRLSWPLARGADSYELWRSAAGAAPVRIAETSEATYVDRDVEYGREYRYQIRPARYAEDLSEPASARTTAFPADRFPVEGTAAVSGGSLAVAVDRSYAYLAAGEKGLLVMEVRDPARPAALASVELAGARDVALATLGDGKRYALVADAERGLAVVDVSTPSRPEAVGSRATTDARAVVVLSDKQARLAYVADGDAGLKVLDLSSPRRPERVASLQVGSLQALALRPPRLYAVGEAGLYIFDLRDPAAPALLAEVPLPGARGVAAEDRQGRHCVLVARGAEGVAILDATDPRRVSLLAELRDAGPASAIAAAASPATHAYVARGAAGILVLDAAEPRAPAIVGGVAAGEVRDVTVAETAEGAQFAYAACADGLRVVRILEHGRSLELGSFPTDGRGYDIRVSDLGTRSLYALVADHARGLRVFRLEGVGSAEFGGSGFVVPTSFACSAVPALLAGRWCVLVADAEGGVRVFDVSGIEGQDAGRRALEVGSIYASDARGVAVYAPRPGAAVALAADRTEGIRVLDAGEPEKLRQLALVAAPETLDVAVAEPPGSPPIALAAAGEGALVLELGSPEAPVVRGRIAGPPSRRVVTLDSARSLFALVTAAGVCVVDCSSPQTPRVTASHATEFGEGLHVGRAGGLPRLYLAEGYRGLSVLDAGQPATLRRVSSCAEVYAVAVAGIDAEDGRSFAFAVAPGRVVQIEVLVPRWIAEEP